MYLNPFGRVTKIGIKQNAELNAVAIKTQGKTPLTEMAGGIIIAINIA